jgi:hypothetical protein
MGTPSTGKGNEERMQVLETFALEGLVVPGLALVYLKNFLNKRTADESPGL